MVHEAKPTASLFPDSAVLGPKDGNVVAGRAEKSTDTETKKPAQHQAWNPFVVTVTRPSRSLTGKTGSKSKTSASTKTAGRSSNITKISVFREETSDNNNTMGSSPMHGAKLKRELDTMRDLVAETYDDDKRTRTPEQTVRHLQARQARLTEKKKKIQYYIDFLSQLLPPNPCTHDLNERRKLMEVREQLVRKLDKVDKQQYETGILLVRELRKMKNEGSVADFWVERS